MTTATEAAASKSQLGADLAAGVNTLSLDDSVIFTKYVRLVLPLDGFVFWVRADLVSGGALMNASSMNAFALGAAPEVVTPAPTLTVKGSLHYATDRRQEEDQTLTKRSVVFTALGPVKDFSQIGPQVIYVATLPDGDQFAFSSRAAFYRLADLYHYRGDAVYSTMQTQLVDALDGFDSRHVVVSNSLPLWLALNSYAPPYAPSGFSGGRFQLYPSFAVPQNLPPPYAAVHVDYSPGRALQMTPTLGRTLTHDQLVVDRVRVTTYGVRNFEIMDFVDLVYQYSEDTDAFGIMNSPIPRDEKFYQTELAALAQKKSVEFEINYYQQAIRNRVRQLITQCIPTFSVVAPSIT